MDNAHSIKSGLFIGVTLMVWAVKLGLLGEHNPWKAEAGYIFNSEFSGEARAMLSSSIRADLSNT
jgi:hypothetical protein